MIEVQGEASARQPPDHELCSWCDTVAASKACKGCDEPTCRESTCWSRRHGICVARADANAEADGGDTISDGSEAGTSPPPVVKALAPRKTKAGYMIQVTSAEAAKTEFHVKNLCAAEVKSKLAKHLRLERPL